jgi:hypothetical protein
MSKLITNDQIRALATFLKVIQDTTTGGCIVNMAKEAKEGGIPYSSNIGPIMVRKGILKREQDPDNGRQSVYHWISTTDANLHMAKAIIKEARETTVKGRLVNNREETNTKQGKDLNGLFKVLISDGEYNRLLATTNPIQISIILDNGSLHKVRFTVWADKHPIYFNEIRERLLKKQFKDHYTHVELMQYLLKGEVRMIPTFITPNV